MKPSEVIREARDVLFERGWHKGDLLGPGGSVCAYGALIVAAGLNITRAGERAPDHAERCVLAATAGERPDDEGIGPWNDAPERTFDEVIETLEKAEKLALIAEALDA